MSGGAAVLRVMTEPQEGASYDALLGMALAAERAGWDGFFRSDHLLTIGPGGPLDATEAWTTLAALARETSRLRLGTLVTPMTFRHPSVLARMVATVDRLSGGRIELGVGAGWYEPEHRTLGIPFAPLSERMDRFEEAVSIIDAMLAGATVDHDGPAWVLRGATCLPRPVQERVPIIVGGHGGRRSAALAARFAAEYNTLTPPGDELAAVVVRLREACERAGRDPATLRLSWMGPCIVGEDRPALRRRARAYSGWRGPGEQDLDDVLEAMGRRGVVGTHEQAAEQIAALREAGCARLYLQLLDLEDHEVLTEIASLVGPQA